MIVAIYARVSTVDQSCEMQLHELRQYAQRQSFQIFAEYVDTGFSGAAASRPQLDELLRNAHLHRFDAVLVWKLDRWGRSVAHCVRTIQELVDFKIRFLSPNEGIDRSAESPMSHFLLHLFAAFAEMEREIIGERRYADALCRRGRVAMKLAGDARDTNRHGARSSDRARSLARDLTIQD